MTRRLWLHLFLPIMTLLLAAFALLFWCSIRSAERQTAEKTGFTLQTSAESASMQLEAWTDSLMEELTRFASLLSEQELTAANALSLLRLYFPGTAARRTAVVSSSGIAYYDDGVTADVAADGGFQAALAGECTVEVRKGERGVREGRIVLSAPVGDGADWVVLCGISDSALTGLLDAFAGASGAAMLVEPDGSILATSGEVASGTSLFSLFSTDAAPTVSPSDSSSASADAAEREDGGTLVALLQAESAASGTFTSAELGTCCISCVPVGVYGWKLLCCAPCEDGLPAMSPWLIAAAVAFAAFFLFTLLVSVCVRRMETAHTRLAEQDALLTAALSAAAVELWKYDTAENAFTRLELSGEEKRSETFPASDLLAERISPESYPAFRKLLERLQQGERQVSEVLRVRDGHYLRFTFRNRFDETGKPCGAVGHAEDCTFRQELCRRVDRQNSRMEDAERSFLLAARWNLSHDMLEKTVGVPEGKPDASPRARLLAALAPEKPAALSGLHAGRLLRQYDVCHDRYDIPFVRRGVPARPVWLEVRLLRDPASLDVLAFLFLTEED